MSSAEHGDVDEEQTRLTRDVLDSIATHGSPPGRVLATLKRQFLANETTNGVNSCCKYIFYTYFLQFPFHAASKTENSFLAAKLILMLQNVLPFLELQKRPCRAKLHICNSKRSFEMKRHMRQLLTIILYFQLQILNCGSHRQR